MGHQLWGVGSAQLGRFPALGSARLTLCMRATVVMEGECGTGARPLVMRYLREHAGKGGRALVRDRAEGGGRGHW